MADQRTYIARSRSGGDLGRVVISGYGADEAAARDAADTWFRDACDLRTFTIQRADAPSVFEGARRDRHGRDEH